MSHQSHNDSRPVFPSISKASFGVAGLAFIGSFAGAAINSTLSGWMAVAGMAGLGLFYLALGVLNLGHAPKSLFVSDAHQSGSTPDSRSRSHSHDNRSNQPAGSRQEDESELDAQPDELVEA